MANCSNCYNGCSEISTDKCIKYTGVDVPVLGIKKGDSLSYVEQALITFLAATLNGSGITISLEDEDYCELVSQYLQECSTVTALDLFKALVQAACNIQTQIDTINSTLSTLNGDYTVGCLSGVTSSSDTHAVVQAVITKLCSIDTSLTALSLDVATNYVKISDLNGYIAAYIESTASATRYSSRMVPYAIYPYYGSLGYFDATGAGIEGTEWEDIYLCNGHPSNGTPDLRGRVLVGAISGVPGGALSSAVDPSASAFNPNYALGTTAGVNSVTLTETQIPSHTHTVNDPEHTHKIAVDTAVSGGDLSATGALARQAEGLAENEYQLRDASSGTPSVGEVGSSETGITLGNTGGGAAHANNQPAIGVYYIMYIPS